MTIRTLIIVSAACRDAANEAARQMQRAKDGTDAGAGTFNVPLFAAGAEDDTAPVAWWCAVTLTTEQRSDCEAMLGEFPGSTITDYDLDTDPGFPQRHLAAVGLRTARPFLS